MPRGGRNLMLGETIREGFIDDALNADLHLVEERLGAVFCLWGVSIGFAFLDIRPALPA